MFNRLMPVFAIVAGACFASAALAGEVRLAGSTTLGTIVKAKTSEIETASGSKINVVANGSGKGVADLAAGKADIAMIAGDAADVAAGLNAKTPNTVDAATLKEFQVGTDPVAIIGWGQCPVANLTVAQVKDMFSGKITNWKDVGGPDQAVVVIVPPQTDGVRTYIQKNIMGETQFVAGARTLQLGPDVVKAIGQVPGSIGFVGANNAGETVKTIKTDSPIALKLNLVTKGDATAEQRKVMEAIKAEVAKAQESKPESKPQASAAGK
jgi:phosphate transport system substrate-binding protein